MIAALDLAKYIVSKCTNENKPISNLQLQKILYYIQYGSLKEISECIFYDEIEAWQFGPVVPNVYYYFCNFGAMPINLKFKGYMDIIKDVNNIEMVDNILTIRREQNPWEMVKETHKDNSPWTIVFNQGEGKVISVGIIKEYIKKNGSQIDA